MKQLILIACLTFMATIVAGIALAASSEAIWNSVFDSATNSIRVRGV